MLTPQFHRRNRRLIWRIAGLWMVVLALGLALIGMFLALQQTRSFTVRLMAQAEALAAHVAADARNRLDAELKALLGAILMERHGPSGRLRQPPTALPGWIDGVFLWDGQSVRVLVASAGDQDEIRRLIAARFAPKPWPMFPPLPDPRTEIRFIVQSTDQPHLALGYLSGPSTGDGRLTVLARLDLPRLRSDFLEPLVPFNAGLGLVDIDETSGPWWQQLSGPMRFWAIEPTSAVIREQRSMAVGQTLAYLGLTVLSLITLLLAMWFLTRLARREVALAHLKANFVADVSHELKTPLALIRLFGETLQAGRVTTEEKRQEYYAIITRESTRLTNLINNILDFARIEAGRKEYTFELTDIGQVVRETYEAYQAQLDHGGFERHFSMEQDLPPVLADRDAVSQAVLNLISNAIKYSEEERYIEVEVTRDTRRGRHGVLISIHDRGIGLRPEDRAHLAEGFFRSADGRVRQRGGTGLGLALVKHIVEAHQGTLDAEPRLVKGSTFRIFLPAAEKPYP